VIEPACVLKKALHKALAAFFDVVEEHTLADLLKPSRALSQLLAVPVCQQLSLTVLSSATAGALRTGMRSCRPYLSQMSDFGPVIKMIVATKFATFPVWDRER
jgi:hypothetical protein